ncbi:MAG TPA: MATE family efflux transporter [Dysgonamonadaceae bacterium]|nr:MATE family efflux transporter [Dysgonamonadaceae bacterium]
MIKLSDSFNYTKLLRYTFPAVIMLVFTSIYGVVDGFFVSNFVGKTPFAAVNFIMPLMMILGSVGFMFGTGGSALIAKTIGEGDKEKANKIFSLIIYISLAISIVLTVLAIIFMRPIASALGADGQLLEDSITYGRLVAIAIPAFVLQTEFQILFATGEKPKIGLYITIAAGVTNIVLDALFIVVFSWGLVGAAVATALSLCVGGVVPLFFFARKNSSLLRLTKTKFDGHALLRTITNGSSEFVNHISMSIVGVLFNMQLLKYAGVDGVAAYGVIMYVNMIFISVYLGYAVGVAPIISYHFGAQNRHELKGLVKKSVLIMGGFSLIMFALAQFLAKPMSIVFVGYDQRLMDMTQRALFLYAFSFLFSGVGIFGSSFFTAMNDGLTSALIAFMRTLIFQTGAVFLFPLLWGVDGIWLSVVLAEAMALLVTILFFIGNRRKYHY